MKQRARKTYPILAVVLSAAGCAREAPPEPRPNIVVAPAPVPAPPGAESAERGNAVVPAAWSRPLRDEDGYPLVGNLIRKGGPPERPDAGADGGRPSR